MGAATDRQFGAVTVLVGEKNGKYPHGNSLWVRGREATVVIDPSLSVVARADELRGQADLVIQSHVHEDHVAGVHLFPRAKVYAHREDAPGLRSIDGLMNIYGYESLDEAMRQFVIDQFHYAARPDTHDFDDGEVFALGDTQVRAIHTPGHTRGHCVLLIEPEGVLFLGDIDLSGFGPYYGDAWSNLEDFERSLQRVREIEARVWVSFHHAGVIDDRDTFVAKLDRFAGEDRRTRGGTPGVSLGAAQHHRDGAPALSVSAARRPAVHRRGGAPHDRATSRPAAATRAGGTLRHRSVSAHQRLEGARGRALASGCGSGSR